MLLPAAAIVLANRSAERLSLSPHGRTTAKVRQADQTTQEPVSLKLTWGQEQRVFAPSLNGFVESVFMRPGETLRSLDIPLVVGGIRRIAFAGTVPFSQPLSWDSTGKEVRALNDLLAALHLPSDSGDQFTTNTARGTSRLARQLGASDGVVFDPSWVLFMPEDQLTITAVDVFAGQPAPPPGSQIASGTTGLERADVIPRAQASTEATRADGGSLPGSDVPPVVLPPEAHLTVAGTELTLSDDRRSVATTSLPALATLIREDASVVDALASTQPAPTDRVVPSAAVFSGDGGQLCVRRVGPADGDAVPVDLVNSELGVSVVRGAIEPGDEVELFVAAKERTCPSP